MGTMIVELPVRNVSRILSDRIHATDKMVLKTTAP
jgi:hypothetical protein